MFQIDDNYEYISLRKREGKKKGKGARAICSFKSIPSARRKRNSNEIHREMKRDRECAEIASNLAYESALEHDQPT